MKLLPKYIALHHYCFPTFSDPSPNYLTWLYKDNPVGTAVGVDALYGEDVVGQVIAIPGEFMRPDDRIAVEGRFYGELENIVEQYNMSSGSNHSLIDNGFFMDSEDICDSNHHASQVGRRKQTRRVISFMKAHPH